MTHGLEKLEKFFGGSKRRERSRQRAAQQQKISGTRCQPSSPIFPSPSFLRPTSMNMKPRNAQIESSELDEESIESILGLDEHPWNRSSVASSLTIVDSPNSSGQSSHETCSRRPGSQSSEDVPRLSRFRFPEDSLFKNDELLRISEDTYRQDDGLLRCGTSQASEEGRLLNWSPKHISLLFNPLEFEPSFSERISHNQVDNDDTAESMILLPSPDFGTSTSMTEINGQCPNSRPNTSSDAKQYTVESPSPQRLTLFPNPSSLTRQRAIIDSPPVSVCGEDYSMVFPERCMSLSAPSSPRLGSCRHPSADAPSTVSGLEDIKRRKSLRETWGNRSEDPSHGDSPVINTTCVPRSRLSRKQASTASLSICTKQIAKDSVLKEPTFDDFYALSDEDIAESRPATPAPDALVPPTPPPKDNGHVLSGIISQDLPAMLTARLAAINPCSGEITPPCTPTKSQALTLSYSPSNSRNTLGALWACELAKKYNFAVLYVVSLWPECNGQSLDPSKRPTSDPENLEIIDTNIPSQRQTPRTTGRLLAAYGLHEVTSPFEIVTETHVNALKNNHWNEYRNNEARPDDISRGWIRPFYSDHIPVASSPTSNASFRNTGAKNRGIIFAAYVKRDKHTTVPMKSSPEQSDILQRIYVDAKVLVEALVEGSRPAGRALEFPYPNKE